MNRRVSALREPRVLIPAMAHPSSSKERAGGQQKPMMDRGVVDRGAWRRRRTGNEGAKEIELEAATGGLVFTAVGGRRAQEDQKTMEAATDGGACLFDWISKKNDLLSVFGERTLRSFCTKICANLK